MKTLVSKIIQLTFNSFFSLVSLTIPNKKLTITVLLLSILISNICYSQKIKDLHPYIIGHTCFYKGIGKNVDIYAYKDSAEIDQNGNFLKGRLKLKLDIYPMGWGYTSKFQDSKITCKAGTTISFYPGCDDGWWVGTLMYCHIDGDLVTAHYLYNWREIKNIGDIPLLRIPAGSAITFADGEWIDRIWLSKDANILGTNFSKGDWIKISWGEPTKTDHILFHY